MPSQLYGSLVGDQSHKGTQFYFYYVKMKLELMLWEGTLFSSSALSLALAELTVNTPYMFLSPFSLILPIS